MHLSDHRFSPAHALIYAVNGFFGPDIGSFCEWLAMTSGAGEKAAAVVMRSVHDPLGYAILLGAPLGFAYSWVTQRLVREVRFAVHGELLRFDEGCRLVLLADQSKM